MVLPFAAAGNHQLANATNKVEYDSTSTICIDDMPCVTTICINNQQCHTITSNYTNAGNSTNNKHSIVSPFPQKTSDMQLQSCHKELQPRSLYNVG
jgi:hypothetical protein